MALETVAKFWRIIPDMGRELRPPEQSFAVEQFPIMQVVWLMSVAEGVESSIFCQFHACFYLLVAEGMALSKFVLVLACAINEDRLAVQHESLVAVIACLGP